MAMKIRLLPGQVVVREIHPEPSTELWTPGPGRRDQKTHTGRVLAMGPPARLNGSGPEVPHGFGVGSLVQYHFTSNQDAATRPWPLDGEPATWVPQEVIDGVWRSDTFEIDGVEHTEGSRDCCIPTGGLHDDCPDCGGRLHHTEAYMGMMYTCEICRETF